MKNVEFWFSIGSTYTFLTVMRILDIEKKYQLKFIWKPFSVRNIMMKMDNIPFTPPAKKIKSDYMWRDIERRAKFYGFDVKVPAPYPLSEFDLANKIAILGFSENWGIDYVRLTYKRWFQDGKEPAIQPNLSEILNLLDLDPKEIINKSQEKKIDEIYLKNTDTAFNKKIFGSPTFVYKNEIFWGDDRLEDCIKWLEI